MNTVKQWLLLDPLDTLFFKGSEPMVLGENHEVRSVFPPQLSTFYGAVCTGILQQRGIKPKDFVSPEGRSTKLRESYPLLGEPGHPGFKLLGPIFRVTLDKHHAEWFLPAPAHWFADLKISSWQQWENQLDQPAHFQEVRISVADVCGKDYQTLGLKGSVDKPVWVLEPRERDLQSLSGFWVNHEAFQRVATRDGAVRLYENPQEMETGHPILLPLWALFEQEARVGIALEFPQRRARMGHLYVSTQIRLISGVRMAIGVSDSLVPSHLDEEGILALGGEQRIVHYQLLEEGPVLPKGDSPWCMALSSFPFSQLKELQWDGFPKVSGNLIRMGGWDMKANFHKPMTAYLPAGTVVQTGDEALLPFGFIRV
jgi:CRISPR-associated protein Cmr3